MKTINAKWTDCAFGIENKTLKLTMDVEFEGAELPKQIQLILAFNCLALIATQEGMDAKELYAMAFRNEKKGG